MGPLLDPFLKVFLLQIPAINPYRTPVSILFSLGFSIAIDLPILKG